MSNPSDSSKSTDSFRARQPTLPDDNAKRITRLERDMAIFGERQETQQRVQGEMRTEMQLGFRSILQRLDADAALRNAADLRQEVSIVRGEEQQRALKSEVKALGKVAGQSAGGKTGAVAGGGAYALLAFIHWVIELFRQSPPPTH